MNKPHLTISIVGGAHSGKTELAKLITKAVAKDKSYGISMHDGAVATADSGGPIKVMLQTMEFDLQHEPMQVSNVPSVQVSVADLKSAFLDWELQIRQHGASITVEQQRALPAGQVAENAAVKLWTLLTNQGA